MSMPKHSSAGYVNTSVGKIQEVAEMGRNRDFMDRSPPNYLWKYELCCQVGPDWPALLQTGLGGQSAPPQQLQEPIFHARQMPFCMRSMGMRSLAWGPLWKVIQVQLIGQLQSLCLDHLQALLSGRQGVLEDHCGISG